MKLKALTHTMIQRRVYNAMTDAGLSPRTVRLVHSILHNALDYAVEKAHKLTRNPAAGATLPKKTRREMRPLSLDEARTFLQVIAGTPAEALLAMLLTTGLRPSEAFALKWPELDLEGAAVTVRTSLTRTKGGVWKISGTKTANAVRTIPLPSPTVFALRAHRARQLKRKMKLGDAWPDHGFVFTNAIGEPLERHNVVRRAFKPALEALAKRLYPADDEEHVLPAIQAQRDELLSVRLYDLRHTCATLALLQGVNAKVISERLGHGSIVITLDTYSHVLPNMQQAATDLLSTALYGTDA